jgi:hypothetical protein
MPTAALDCSIVPVPRTRGRAYRPENCIQCIFYIFYEFSIFNNLRTGLSPYELAYPYGGRPVLKLRILQKKMQTKPHPASIASTRPAVARCALKQVAQVVQNRSCVTNWHKKKFSQDMIYRDDIKYGLSVVKLV